MRSIMAFNEIVHETPNTYNYTLQPGLYLIEIQGATGGLGCDNGEPKNPGGNGANIKAKVIIRGGTEVYFKVGEKPSTNSSCESRNPGGWPGGGFGGDESNTDYEIWEEWAGGGGGYTEMLINRDTIMLAGGGAGGCRPASQHGSGFGGGLHTFGGFNNEDEPVLIDESERHAETRVGDKGKDQGACCYPGGGGGGGWRGGFGGWNYINSESHCAGWGGSSYINTIDDNYWFSETPIVLDGSKINHDGHGYLKITILYECSKDCYHCTGKNTCVKCVEGSKLYQSKCYSSCEETSEKTFDNGNDQCELCSSDCGTCSGSSTRCTSCKDGYVLNENNQCILHVPEEENNDDNDNNPSSSSTSSSSTETESSSSSSSSSSSESSSDSSSSSSESETSSLSTESSSSSDSSETSSKSIETPSSILNLGDSNSSTESKGKEKNDTIPIIVPNSELANEAEQKKKMQIISIASGVVGGLILILIVAVIVIYILTRKGKDEDSVSEEMVEETVIFSSDMQPHVTIDNPLWTTSVLGQSDDIFKGDFSDSEVAVGYIVHHE
ncbi:hypothetical protein TVAG_210940 [Trichomonas vaginalis G3]|uniref:receptor protein-tyrosine kinase n=1 Tax=Trichomonas vaginalis (strain ATCC PRA-98 / G3) TaxID=412133 RepID=A2F879_TRIV3|nr:serine-type endopeptidase protein [Trichomonas vaginalis G3]EAX98899.1 hypothetical protein TVAG_210940 [Trichomonas vaginalis G3]KAI5511638.1 serine-type endopeptidase protein [Trichomonas vaginalis G3]|eukprot:XP_001311829.1 hypothetical protein [Trichomonas vaginalis G3]